MVDPFLGIDLERQCKSQDKTVVYWKEMWHAVFAEDELPEVIEAVTEWMGARVGKWAHDQNVFIFIIAICCTIVNIVLFIPESRL